MSHLQIVKASSRTSKAKPTCACGRARTQKLPSCTACIEKALDFVAEHASQVDALKEEVVSLKEERLEILAECQDANEAKDSMETTVADLEKKVSALDADRELLLTLTGISERRFEMERSALECRSLFTEVLS